MTTVELEQVIREYIRNIYNKEYLGKLTIEKLTPIGYKISMGLPSQYKPLVIYGEMEDEKFLKYLKLELKRFHLVDYGLVQLQYAPINHSCNDKRRIN